RPGGPAHSVRAGKTPADRCVCCCAAVGLRRQAGDFAPLSFEQRCPFPSRSSPRCIGGCSLIISARRAAVIASCSVTSPFWAMHSHLQWFDALLPVVGRDKFRELL